MDKINQKKIYLYSHSPEAEQAVEAGEASIKAGGVRRPDGTLIEMAKPLSFTIDELRDLFNNEGHLLTIDEEVQQLGSQIGVSQESLQQLQKNEWLNKAMLDQIYSMTYDGFRHTLVGIENLSTQLSRFERYIYQRDKGDLLEKVQKYINYLKSDARKLDTLKFDVTNSSVDEHLNEISAFLKRLYEDLLNGMDDGFLTWRIIFGLIVPFANVVRKYVTLFFYDNKMNAGSYDEWIKVIKSISSNPAFRNKIQYYINLETELPYRDKMILGQKCCKKIAALPNIIAFDAEYALYHSKEEYLCMSETIRNIMEDYNGTSKTGDGRIYL